MRTRYSTLQIGLHWLSALLVVTVIALPYGLDLFEPLLGGTGNVFTLHKSLGLTVLALTLLRLLARACYGTPALPGSVAPWQQSLARFGHALLYLTLILMPLSGLLFGRRPVELFWLVEVGPVPLDNAWRDVARLFHLTTQYLLFAMIFGHACVALWHHYRLRDGVLQTMLPRRR